MITFILACVGLILLSGLFFLLPPRPVQIDANEREKSNLEWYHLRRAELADQGDEELVHDIGLRMLEDMDSAPSAAAQGQPNPVQQRFPVWFLLPLIALASGGLYYLLGSAPDVQIKSRLMALDEHSTPEQMDALMQAIEFRSQQRPKNLHYRSLLGRYYMGQEDYSRAADAYSALVKDAPGDAYALALAAQSRYLAGGRALDDGAQMLAEQSLAIDPHQRTALGLLGMASFESGQYRAAIAYWERLLAMEPAGSEAAAMIAGVVDRAREKLGSDSAELVVADQVTLGVSIRVSLPKGAQVAPSDTVFVLARAANSQSRMPIAVQRLRGADLPAVLRLDDSSSMAGQKLSEAPAIVVVVQVSPTGQPGEANASWLGDAGPLAPSLDMTPVDVVLRSRD